MFCKSSGGQPTTTYKWAISGERGFHDGFEISFLGDQGGREGLKGQISCLKLPYKSAPDVAVRRSVLVGRSNQVRFKRLVVKGRPVFVSGVAPKGEERTKQAKKK